MNKLLLSMLFVLFLFSFTFADSIDDLTIESNVYLNNNQTVYAVYNATDCSNILCSLIVFDDANIPVYRASDEYTNTSCIFSTQFKIIEPTFIWNKDYNVNVYCKDVSAIKSFKVENREPLAQSVLANVFWFRENIATFLYLGIVFIFILILALFLIIFFH